MENSNSRVGLLGDTHANYAWTAFALWKFHREGITRVLQLGDLGLGKSNYNAKFLKRVSKLAVHYGITLYVTLGNHEDWNYAEELFSTTMREDGWAEVRPNLLIAPRGLRWTWDDVSFVSLGGAPSVDRGWRVEEQAKILDPDYHLWFPGEMITQEDVDLVVAGGYADVMVAHDAPMGVPTIDKAISSNPHGFRPADLLYAADGRKLMDDAFRGVRPRTFLHGHYHMLVDDMIRTPSNPNPGLIETADVKWTHVLGLNCDGRNYFLGQYDLKARKADAWDIRPDIDRYNKEGGNFS
jgi:Calcineurin-like phosphoesterase